MRTLTLRLSDGKGNKARNKETRQGKAQQGRESLQKMLNFLKARRRRKGGINPPLPRAPSPLFEERYPPSPHGGNLGGSFLSQSRTGPGSSIRCTFYRRKATLPVTLSGGRPRGLGTYAIGCLMPETEILRFCRRIDCSCFLGFCAPSG